MGSAPVDDLGFDLPKSETNRNRHSALMAYEPTIFILLPYDNRPVRLCLGPRHRASILSQSACPSTDHRPVVHSSIRPIQSRFPCVSYISSHPSNGHNGYSVQLEFFFIPPIRDRRRPIVICGIFTFKLTVFFFLIRILKSRCIAFVFFFAFFKGRFSIMTNRIGVVACFPI